MRQKHVKGMIIDGLTIVEDFPELNKRLRVATEGIQSIFQQIASNLDSPKNAYEFFSEDYERCFKIVEVLIEEQRDLGADRIVLVLECVRESFIYKVNAHKIGGFTESDLELEIMLSSPERWEVYLLE